MSKKAKKVFVSVIVGLVTLGLVAAYIPLLFIRPEQIPQPPTTQQEQVIVPLIPEDQTNKSTSTANTSPSLEGLTGFASETQSLDSLNNLLEGFGN